MSVFVLAVGWSVCRSATAVGCDKTNAHVVRGKATNIRNISQKREGYYQEGSVEEVGVECHCLGKATL